ncbi:acyl CoA:acetate/3-ketoacid CoA transferase [Paenibacillus sp. FSL H8-0034]|uniref:acyl CoA:acetate/3-ketoacid CoA transferase n=1 Tax=Paenibacillus sp. FSL H8-0034 TaxID=2954671 RepID=UPI0030F66190
MVQIIKTEEAAALIKDNDTLWIGGSGGGHAVPEKLIEGLEGRFIKTGFPRSLTCAHAVGIGDWKEAGMNRLAHSGLIKRSICGTLTNSPRIADMALSGEIESYTFPQGVLSQLTREMAGGRPGLITTTGLHTFIDPRLQGGQQGSKRGPDLVEVLEIDNKEYLRYKPIKIDVAFIRATTADEKGNLTMEHEAVFGENLSIATAARRTGGIVIAQVERLTKNGTLQGKQVKVPGILVDYIVIDKEPWQTYVTKFDPAYAGYIHKLDNEIAVLPLDSRKIIARRAAMELFKDAVVNLGFGVANGISLIAAEEGFYNDLTLTVEQGLVGGIPALGNDAGAATNYEAMIDQPYQFDFYDSGGLDLAFLSFAEVDRHGNVNVSRFGNKIVGPGGFINITQNAKKVFFLGTLTAGKSDVRIEEGNMVIHQDGSIKKFIQDVEQITWSGGYALERQQTAKYITERAVFDLTPDGIMLKEIAPGVDIQRDVLDKIDFPVIVPPEVPLMDARIFNANLMNLKDELKGKEAR